MVSEYKKIIMSLNYDNNVDETVDDEELNLQKILIP